MLIAISEYKKPLAEVDVYRKSHHEYIKKFIDEDKLLVCGRKNPPSGGVMISDTVTREVFEAILREDPFVQAGVTEYRIVEFTPSFCSKRFAERK